MAILLAGLPLAGARIPSTAFGGRQGSHLAHPSVGSATARPAQLPSRPGPEDIAKGLRAEDDVDEIVKLCADLVAAGFIEPTTWRRGRRSGHGPCL